MNFLKITTTSFLAILMAGTLIPQSAVSESTETQPLQNALLPKETFQGQVNYVVTGGTLRRYANTPPGQYNNGSGCYLKYGASSAPLSGIPDDATIQKAYLYWAGSGTNVDNTVKFHSSVTTNVTADRTYTDTVNAAGNSLSFFQGVKDVTDFVSDKRNGDYYFWDLNVDNSGNYCNTETVLSGWSLIVVFEDPSITKLNTIELYEGFEGSFGETTNYTLDGISVSADPVAKFSMLLWEGDSTLGGNNEAFKFNNNVLGDNYNPNNNQFNSSINTLGSTSIYGVDLDTFDVSNYVSEGDTSITGSITTDLDLVIQGAALVMVSDDLADGDSDSGGDSASNITKIYAD